jgi:hypothetical protein
MVDYLLKLGYHSLESLEDIDEDEIGMMPGFRKEVLVRVKETAKAARAEREANDPKHAAPAPAAPAGEAPAAPAGEAPAAPAGEAPAAPAGEVPAAPVEGNPTEGGVVEGAPAPAPEPGTNE